MLWTHFFLVQTGTKGLWHNLLIRHILLPVDRHHHLTVKLQTRLRLSRCSTRISSPLTCICVDPQVKVLLCPVSHKPMGVCRSSWRLPSAVWRRGLSVTRQEQQQLHQHVFVHPVDFSCCVTVTELQPSEMNIRSSLNSWILAQKDTNTKHQTHSHEATSGN